MLRKIPVWHVSVIVRFEQLVTPPQGGGIEPQDPTGLRSLRAAEAHGIEHPTDCLVRDDYSLAIPQQDCVGSRR